MQNEWNRSVNMRGNETINLFVLVICTRLRPPHETFRCYMLYISVPNSLRDVWIFEIPTHDHIF